MPLYNFHCAHCEATVERFCTISDRNSMTCETCSGKVETVVAAPSIVSGVRGLHQMVPTGFKDVLSAIQKGAPRSKNDPIPQMKGL